jgi:DNA-3-methyladenine glycosylase II
VRGRCIECLEINAPQFLYLKESKKVSAVVLLTRENEAVKYLCQRDKRLSRVIDLVGDYTYRPYDDSFSFLANQIIGQMLSAKVSVKISERLEKLCNGAITPKNILEINDCDMRSTGMSLAKAHNIKNLALAVKNGEIAFEEIDQMDDSSVIRELTRLKGIGNWTAKMYLIFVLDRPDVLPYEDMAFLQSYAWMYKASDLTRKAIEKKCKKWKPYTSLGARYLYKALDLGLTKTDFHLFKSL